MGIYSGFHGKRHISDKGLSCSLCTVPIVILLIFFIYSQLKTYEAEIPQEDGTDVVETVDEAKNIVQVGTTFLSTEIC